MQNKVKFFGRLVFPYKGTPFTITVQELTYAKEFYEAAPNSIDFCTNNDGIFFYLNNKNVTEKQYLEWVKEQEFEEQMKELLND